MSLDKTEIDKIAWLARLQVTASESEKLTDQLGNILELVEQMNSANTEGVEPLAHPLELSARLRTDEVSEENQRDTFQKIAPDVEDGHYLVPKVID